MHRRIRSLATFLVLPCISIAVVLGAAELFLRVFPQFLPPMARIRIHWIELPTTVSHGDPVTGFLYPANHHGVYDAGEIHFTFTTDAQGFRNPVPCDSDTDIVVIGDSEVFGYGVDDSVTWTSLLSKQLPQSCITNLGLPGMSPTQYLRVYQRFGAPLHPKLVILGLFPGNDLDDERSFGAWTAAGSPGNYDTWRFFQGAPPGLAGAGQRLLDHSYLYWMIRETIRRVGQPKAPPAMTFPDGGRIRFTPDLLQKQVRLAAPDSPTFQHAMGSIEQADSLAHQNGSTFLVIVLPTKEDVYLPLRGDSVPPLRPAFIRALEARRIPYLDLTPPMQEAARRRERLFFEVDGHPNAAGYRVIADAVLNELHRHAADYHLTDWN
ncbi:MAG TPA: GDSL-type esterase/lipase family protein [Gemmatimonadales bacterium]|nr:GDSL-type esterase/lipase family protein [Gemmatimonadales bacterium]